MVISNCIVISNYMDALVANRVPGSNCFLYQPNLFYLTIWHCTATNTWLLHVALSQLENKGSERDINGVMLFVFILKTFFFKVQFLQ